MRGYRAGRGRGGGFGHGNGRMGHGYWNDDQGTDAIVLGGGDDSSSSQYSHSQSHYYSTENDEVQQSPSQAQGGKMQKVGDKWVFVRTDS